MNLKQNPFISISPEVFEIVKELQNKIFNVKDCGLTYRSLNHYHEVGIIDSNKSSKASWRKFSGMELIWIKTIVQLRELGISLDKIRLAKEGLFEDGGIGRIDKAQFINNSFKQEIAAAIFYEYDLYLILFSDYTHTFHDSQSQKQWLLKPYKDDAHISIPLTSIVKDIWSKIQKRGAF